MPRLISRLLEEWRGTRKIKEAAAILGILPHEYSDIVAGRSGASLSRANRIKGLTGIPTEAWEQEDGGE